MKLSLTDQFLWSIFRAIQAVDETYDLIAPRTLKNVLHPDLFRLKKEYARKRAEKNFSQFVYYLKKRGYITTKLVGNANGVMLTKKGREKVLRVKWLAAKNKKRPDRKWIMLIFDIPEQKKTTREVLRSILLRLGYEKLQQSVWVCPYDVYAKTEEVVQYYELERCVKLFLIQEIEV